MSFGVPIPIMYVRGRNFKFSFSLCSTLFLLYCLFYLPRMIIFLLLLLFSFKFLILLVYWFFCLPMAIIFLVFQLPLYNFIFLSLWLFLSPLGNHICSATTLILKQQHYAINYSIGHLCKDSSKHHATVIFKV